MIIPEFNPSTDLSFLAVRPKRHEGNPVAGQENLQSPASTASHAVAFSSGVEQYDAIVEQIEALPEIREEVVRSAQETLNRYHGVVPGSLVAAGLIKEVFLNTIGSN